MIESLKNVLINKYNADIMEYERVKQEYEDMAEKIKQDNSDNLYDQQKRALKRNYGFKRFSSKSKYHEELEELEKQYRKNLSDFHDFYDKYSETKKKLSKINVYLARKKLEDIPNYKTLKDFHMTKKDLDQIVEENGLYETFTEEEQKEYDKLR